MRRSGGRSGEILSSQMRLSPRMDVSMMKGPQTRWEAGVHGVAAAGVPGVDGGWGEGIGARLVGVGGGRGEGSGAVLNGVNGRDIGEAAMLE